MIRPKELLLVTDLTEVDPDALALFRATVRSTQSDTQQPKEADLTTRELVAVDPASDAVVGEIAWRKIHGEPDEGDIAIFDRLEVAEGVWSDTSEALAVIAAKELASESIATAVVPGHMAVNEFGALLVEFGIQWLLQD